MSEQAGEASAHPIPLVLVLDGDDHSTFDTHPSAGRPCISARQLDFFSQIVSPILLIIPSNAISNLLPSANYSSIASFSGDLSSLTAPPFILSPVSLTEFPGGSIR